MNTRIRTIFQDSDKHFDPKNTQSYNLTILLSEDGFSFIIADPALGKYISLCIYEPDEILPPGKTARSEKILIAFLSFVNNHPFLGSPFANAQLITETRYSTLIPAALYDAGYLPDYLRYSFHLPENYHIAGELLPSADAWNIYAIPADWKMQAGTPFQKVRIVHAASIFIETVCLYSRVRQLNEAVFIHIRPKWFEMAYLAGQKLIFHNSFVYSTQEDFIYYILFTLGQLNLSPEMTGIFLAGEVEPDSPLHAITVKYLRNVQFTVRIENTGYSYIFDSIPQHYYFTLIHAQQCAL